jgi:hypothetical protein
MRLTWRDGVATVLVALGVAYYAVYLRGFDLAALSNVRTVAAAVFLLGMAACIVGGDLSQVGAPAPMDRGLVVGSVFGTVAMLAATGAMLTGSALVLGVLVADTVLLWTLATVRHLALHRPTPRPARIVAQRWEQPAHDRLDERVPR